MSLGVNLAQVYGLYCFQYKIIITAAQDFKPTISSYGYVIFIS